MIFLQHLFLIVCLLFTVSSCSSGDSQTPQTDARIDAIVMDQSHIDVRTDKQVASSDSVPADLASKTLVENEPNDSVETATSFQLENTLSGTLGQATTKPDIDYYVFQATPGTVLEIELAPKAGSKLQPYLAVGVERSVNNVESFITSTYHDTKLTEASSARLQFLVHQEPKYFLQVMDSRNLNGGKELVGGDDYGYTLTMRSLPVLKPAAVNGKEISGELTQPGVPQYFTIEAKTKNEALMFSQVKTEKNMRAALDLYDKAYNWVEYSTDRRMTYLVDDPTKGPFVLEVRDDLNRGTTGMTYTLALERAVITAAPNTCAEALTPVKEGTWNAYTSTALNNFNPAGASGPCPGGSHYASPDHVYLVHLEAGQKISVEVKALDGWDPALFILQGDCASGMVQCLAGADGATTSPSESLAFTAPNKGDYYLVVDAYGMAHGVYQISVAFK